MLNQQSGPLAWIAFAIVSAFFLFEFVARIEPSLASEQIAAWYRISNGGFGTLSSLFFWIYAPMQLVVGLALDRFGARRFIVPAIAVMSAGVALFASSDNLILAAVGRSLTGLGASFGFVGGLYVVTHFFPESRFAFLSGALNAIGMLGTAVGAVALTGAVEVAGWRTVFLGTAAGGLALCVLAALFLRDGATSGTSTSLVASLRTVTTNRGIWWVAILGALYYMPVNVFGGLWGKAELSADHGLTPVAAETAVSMIFWGMALGSLAAGWLSDRFGRRKWLVAAGATLSGCSYSAVIYGGSASSVFLSSMLFLAGFFGGAQMLTFAIAKDGAPKSVSGTVIAFVNMIGIGAALVFQPMVGTILDMSGATYGLALLAVPVCLAVAAAMALILSEQKDSRTEASVAQP